MNKPDDFVLCLGRRQIGRLGLVPYLGDAPALPPDTVALSLSCWFVSACPANPEVIASVGNKTTTQAGWTLYTCADELILRANFGADHSVELAAAGYRGGRWQHAAGVIDWARRRLALYLNGKAAAGTQRRAAERVEPDSVVADDRLIVGGYTDDAGGHFDHRLGRTAGALVDDFCVYARRLDPVEVAALSAAGRSAAPRFRARAAAPVTGATPVFVNGSEGYAGFRIPAIVRALNGDLLAFAEGRRDDLSDATPVIHIVCKRSSDGGRSWSPLAVVARNVLGGREYACMNPSPVVDTLRGSGRVIVVFNKMEFSEWAITRGRGVSRVCAVYSGDHGRTWRDEQDITLAVHKPYNPSYVEVYAAAAQPENRAADWRKQVPTLGHAIQLRGVDNPALRGRLLFIGCYTEGDAAVFYTRNYAFWSDDLGRSWQTGSTISRRADGSSATGLNEATAVELADGAIMVNSRNYRNANVVGRRAVSVGRFDAGGAICFGPARHDPALIESGVQASLLGCTPDGEPGGDVLLFANPADPRARAALTVRRSDDQGQTWPSAKLIDPGPAAYSDMLALGGGAIGLLYERGNHGGIVFLRVALNDLRGA